MTIAIVLNSSWQAYNFRLNLASALKDEGYEIIFIAPLDAKYSPLLEKDYKFFPLSLDPKGINPISDLKTMIQLVSLFRKTKPDIILNFTIKPNIYGPICASILGIKSINNITGLGTLFIKTSVTTKIAKLLYKISLSLSSKVFFQNNDDKTLFLNENLVVEDKTDLIPGSGVDVNKFKSTNICNKNSKKFLMIARVLKDKGIYEYIDAIKIVKKKYQNVEFQLLGEVGVQNNTAIRKEEVEKWHQEGIIDYLGTTDDVKSFIEKTDCVVLPSYREGTPRSLLEAASMSKPIITTNVTGCKEVVDDGDNGFLCNVKDPEDLAEKMLMFLNLNNEEITAMGNAGREKVLRQFDEKIVIKKYLQTIDLLIKKG